MFLAGRVVPTLLAIATVQALPRRQDITSLSTTQIDGFNSYTHYASAGYCNASETLAWNCGDNCQANSNFKSVASGGDGSSVQYWYVGYDTSLETVIVVHQGTNPKKMLPLTTDLHSDKKKLDSSLFPGISNDIECHSGFVDEHAKTAKDVLAAVQKTMSMYSVTHVTLVGHSLGAALALLDSVYLVLSLPTGTTFQTVCYGLPRVGNQPFANYVDSNLHLTHINNKKDPIPTTPGKVAGFVHPRGEVHIEDSGEWENCPGQDNPSTQCIVGAVPDVTKGLLDDHDGPYNGIKMGCTG